MYSFGDFWAAKQRANPQLGTPAEGNMTLSYDSFRRELEKAYLAGVASGVESVKQKTPSASSFAAMLGARSLMEMIFGRDERSVFEMLYGKNTPKGEPTKTP